MKAPKMLFMLDFFGEIYLKNEEESIPELLEAMKESGGRR